MLILVWFVLLQGLLLSTVVIMLVAGPETANSWVTVWLGVSAALAVADASVGLIKTDPSPEEEARYRLIGWILGLVGSVFAVIAHLSGAAMQWTMLCLGAITVLHLMRFPKPSAEAER